MLIRQGRSLTVVEKKVETKKVSVKQNKREFRAVFVDEKDIGSPILGFAYPKEVTVIRLKLSNRQMLVLASDEITHTRIVGKYRNGAFRRSQADLYATKAKWSYESIFGVTSSGALSFKEASELAAGSIVFPGLQDIAFYGQEDGSVTNERISFPFSRPMGTQWRKHPEIKFTSKIGAEDWQTFLDCIKGKFFSEINNEVQARILLIRAKTLIRHKSRIDRVTKGQCFDGASFDQKDIEICIGERLLFKGRKGGKPIYAVDSPAYGVALYFFSKYEDAKKWANKEISAKQARALAFIRIPHNRGWQEKAGKI